MKSVGIFQLVSYGAVLEAINSLDNFNSIQLLEAFSLGREGQVILIGHEGELSYFRKNLRTADLVKSVIFEYHEELVKSIFHLETNKLEDIAVVIESDFSGYAMEASLEYSKKGFKVVEYYQSRSVSGSTYIIMTGSFESGKKLKKNPVLDNKCKLVTIIDSVGDRLKEYLN